MAGQKITRRINIFINDKEVVNSMSGINRAITKTKNEIKNLDASSADYDQRLKKLKTTLSQLTAQQELHKKALSETPGILNKIKNALGPVGTGFIAAFSITAVVSKANQVIQKGWKTIVDFNQSQADLAGIMGKSRLQVAGLTLDAMRYGATTSFTASQVSGLQIELARLGKTESQIKKMTKGVLNASVALGADLADSAALVGGQLNAFGEQAEKSGEYADVMANSVNISATSFESLSTALPKVSKVAAQEGVTFQKLNAVLGVLADENIRAETAGTGFRNILLESAKAGKPYEEMLQQIRNSSNQSAKAMELFGKENAIVAVTLANSTEKIEKNTKALNDSAGAAERLANTKLDSLSGSTKLFQSAWEGFLLSIEKGDGLIAKTIRKMVDLGTSILNLITPTQKQTDLLIQQQSELNVLAASVTSLNEKNTYRKNLLKEIQEKYPNFLKNLDIEKVTNAEIAKRLTEVNKQYREKIRLVAIEEELQENMNKSVKAQRQILQDTKDLNDIAMKMNISRDGGLQGIVDRVIRMSEAGIVAKGAEAGVVRIWNRIQSNQNLINNLQNQYKELNELGVPKGPTDLIDDDDSAPTNNDENASGDSSGEKDLEKAKKRSEELLKHRLESEKALMEVRRQYIDLDLQMIKDAYDRERALLNEEYDRKIEDTKKKVEEENRVIEELRKKLSDTKNTAADKANIKAELDNRLELQKTYNESIIILEETRDLKLQQLRQKFLADEFKNLSQANERELQSLKTKHNFELASIQSLEDAKEVLRDSLSQKELSKIRTLEDAKEAIRKQQRNKEFELQEQHLIEIAARAQSILQEADMGIQIIAPEEREQLLKYLDEVAYKLSTLGVEKAENNEASGLSGQPLSGLDILGFTPEKWEEVFSNLDTVQGKLEAISMVIGSLGQAMSMFFQFADAADQRSLNRFTRNQEQRRKQLADQLERGYVSQEIYNARLEKLDQERSKKEAEMAYKKAVRERISGALSIVSDTGIGVSKAAAAFPFTSGMPWAGIVAGIGAANLAALMAQPLPPKSGYKDGGFTPFGDPDQVVGDVHAGEYVVPQKVLFSSDPVVPQIISYLESKRKRGFKDGGFTSPEVPLVLPAPDEGGKMISEKMLETLQRTNELLESLEQNGVVAILENNVRMAKKIREKIQDLENIENQTKKR